MKKLGMFLSFFLSLFLIILLASCNISNSSNDNKNNNSTNGIYYLYENNSLDKSSYFNLSDDKWTSDDGVSGSYKIDGTNIVFYMDNEELYSGTIGNGKLTIGSDFGVTIYYKEGSQPGGENYTSNPPTDAITIKFNLNGGSFYSSSEEIKISKNSLITKPENPTKSGCVFLGWTKENNGDTYWNYDTDIATTSITLYAKWEEATDSNSVLLKFESNGGTTINEQRLLIGNSASKPTDPTKEGYLFDGWYSDSAFNKIFNFETLISSNKTIYAKWAKKYTVNFYNYDNKLLKSYETKEGGSVIYDGTTPSKVLNDGKIYKFIGWNSNTKNVLSDLDVKAIFEEVKKGNLGFEYRLSSDKTYYIITGIGDIDSEEIIIPTEFNNLPVKEIDDEGLSGVTNAKRIIIQSNIEKIGKGALKGASNLEELELPYVGSIKNNKNNNHFGYVFGSLYYDNTISITSNNQAYYIPKSLQTVIINGGYIQDNSFVGMTNTKISNVFLGEAVEGANYSSFGSTLSEWKLYIASSENNKKYIGRLGPITYYDAYKENLITEDGITYLAQINEAVVTNVDKTKTSVTIPSTIAINDKTYNVTKIGESAFNKCLDLQSVTLPSNIKYIDKNAFSYCNSLSFIQMPSALIEIGDNAFEHCVSLTSVTMPTNLIKIGNSAFKNCEAINTINLNNKLEYIGNSAFYKCSNITSLEIPDSVYYMGYSSIDGCSKLQYNKITSGDGVGNYLGNSNNKYLWLISTSGSNTTYVMDNRTKHLYPYAFSGLQTINNILYTLSSNLETIGYGAFGNSKFTSINIPESVYWIDYAVFSGKEINEIDLPSGLKHIGNYAFSGCTNLKEISLGNELEYVGYYAFNGDPNLVIYIDADEIPEGYDKDFNPSNAKIVLGKRYLVTLNINNSKAGYVSTTNKKGYPVGEEITITATTNPGYTFNGWFNGNSLLSTNLTYSFTMPTENLVYTAKWTANTNTPYKVEHYWENIDNSNYMLHETENLIGITDTLTNGKVKTYEGFTSPQITQVNINGDGNTVIKLYYTRNSYTFSLNQNIDETDTIIETETYKYGKKIRIRFTAKQGYTFIGWFNGDKELTKELSYAFVMPASNLLYTVKWIANTNTAYKVEHYLQNIDNDNYPSTPYETDNLIGSTDTLTNGEVNIYKGFTSPTITQENINGDGSTVIKLYYTRNSYTVSLSKNNDKAGTITGAGTYKYGKEITIAATTNSGYTFNGCYNGENQVYDKETYTFNMPAESLSYIAKWTANTNTQYKIEHYLQNIDDDNYPSTPYETDNLIGTTDTLTNGSVKTYEGFTSPTITQVNINGDGSAVIKLQYTRNSYTVSLTQNNDKAGTIVGAGTYKYGKEITITTINPGYTFNGWYLTGSLYEEDESFDYTITSSNVSFEARYTINKYTITLDNQVVGVIISGITSGNEYEYNTQITLTATNIPDGYTIKWSRSDNIAYSGDKYTFKVPAGNIIVTTTNRPYTRDGNKIYFGTYPQTKVTDNTLISELNTLAGTKPTSTNSYNWNDYNYYISSTITSFMFYQDVDVDNDGIFDYRGVYFTQYRPYNYSSSSSASNSYQDENSYSTNTIYWFSYDPIEWNILTESNGKALILSNLILDSQDYYPSGSNSSFSHNGGTGYANNYELSAIRKFLNENFYNTAFNDLQKALIEETTIDNSSSTTESSYNNYACNNTNDKLFLLSYSEVTSTTYGLSSKSVRKAVGSGYAKCQGLYVSTEISYFVYSGWWLRSPIRNNALGTQMVSYDGNAKDYYYYVYRTDCGVRPACWINL